MAPKTTAVDKKDGDKTRMDLVPWDAVLGAAAVFTFGSKKYADRGYWHLEWSRIYGAAQRHATAWFLGEESDPETGRSHLDHLACCVLMLSEMEKRGLGVDDRPTT